MLESPKYIQNYNYDGSRTFTWLADLCGLSVDLINFLICQISAIFLASLFRSILHPSKVSTAVRHIFALSVGLAFGYFVFGQQAIHIAGLPTLCYIVIRTQSPKVVQRDVMVVAMSYLLLIHLLRQIYDDGSYSLDVTGPLMIITQKVTSLAYSIHDGFVRQTKDLTKAQQYHAVNKIPTALEYFSYVLHFQGIMAGPLVFYKDYIDFIEGYNLLKVPSKNGNLDNGKSQVVIEPSPTKTVIKKVIGSMICAFIFMKLVKIYPVKDMKEEDFINDTSMGYKFWYAMMATTCIRFKYYHAWLLADAICNNSGLGFTGYDKDGSSKWDLLSNINVLGFEFATNMRDAINNWNIGTNRWLRMIVYERVPKKYGTVLTFALSALWHGFYPGYYLTFATGACMVTAGRMARRMFRHRFQATQFTRMFYDILTCLTTRLVMGYATFPFVLLELKGSVRLYLKFYMCLHIAALVTTFILPRFIRGERSSHSRTSMAATITAENKSSEPNSKEHLPNSSSSNNDISKNAHDNNKINLENNSTKVKTTNKPHKINVNDNDIDNHVDNDTSDIKFKNDLNKIDKEDSFESCCEPLEATLSVSSMDVLNVPHDQCEMDQLSSKLKEKIDAEAKNIEEFIDKTVSETVCGIVEFKNDLMRGVEYPTRLGSSSEGLRKRNANASTPNGNDLTNGNITSLSGTINTNGGGSVSLEESAAFLKKEIEAVVQQANVLPAVLSNGHAK